MVTIILQILANSGAIIKLVQELTKDKSIDPIDRAKIQLELMQLKIQLKMVEEAELAQLKAIKKPQPKRK